MITGPGISGASVTINSPDSNVAEPSKLFVVKTYSGSFEGITRGLSFSHKVVHVTSANPLSTSVCSTVYEPVLIRSSIKKSLS